MHGFPTGGSSVLLIPGDLPDDCSIPEEKQKMQAVISCELNAFIIYRCKVYMCTGDTIFGMH